MSYHRDYEYSYESHTSYDTHRLGDRIHGRRRNSSGYCPERAERGFQIRRGPLIRGARIVEAPPLAQAQSACRCFSTWSCRCHCGQGSASASSGGSRSGQGSSLERDHHATSRAETTTTIKVVDAGGDTFRVRIRTRTTARDLLGCLLPEGGGQTVLVRWESGATEPLDEMTEMEEVRRSARHLEVHPSRRVRFA